MNQQVERVFEKNWSSIQKTIGQKVTPAALAAAQNDSTIKALLDPVYMTLPLPVRLVVKKDVFIRYCLAHRDKLLAGT